MLTPRFLLGCAFLATTLAAHAFERPFPADTIRGVMNPSNYPTVLINGKPRTLSSGARIWNQQNLIEMPASLRGSGWVVHYTETDAGEIDRVWILTPEEIKEPAPKPAKKPAPLPAPPSTLK